MMTNRLSVFAVVLALFFGLGASIVIAQQTNYYNDKYSFSMQPPSGWAVDESGLMGTAVIFYGPREQDFTVNVNIMVEDVPAGTTLGDYISVSKRNLPLLLTNHRVVSERSRVIGGIYAYELVITHTMGIFDLKAKCVALLKDSKAYTITFTALPGNYDVYLPAFEASVETFKFEPKPINWLLIGGIIVAVLVIIGVVAMLYRLRRRKFTSLS